MSSIWHGPNPRNSVAKGFLPLFRYFPQGSSVVHSFCTTQHRFSVAIVSAFAQSTISASVSCIEPAGDCSRAGGDRRFSRVNWRGGFPRYASACFRKLGRCGLLRQSLRKVGLEPPAYAVTAGQELRI